MLNCLRPVVGLVVQAARNKAETIARRAAFMGTSTDIDSMRALGSSHERRTQSPGMAGGRACQPARLAAEGGQGAEHVQRHRRELRPQQPAALDVAGPAV